MAELEERLKLPGGADAVNMELLDKGQKHIQMVHRIPDLTRQIIPHTRHTAITIDK
jgi:hypothetical protein